MIANIETQPAGMTLVEIEKLAGDFAADYNALRAIAADIQAEQEAALKKYLPALRKIAVRAGEKRADLVAAVAAAPQLFEDKKTRVLHGIKVGYRKGAGALVIEDDAAFLARLEKMFPDEAARGIYLRVKVSPIKDALAELPAADLKKLGVVIESTGDVVVVKPADGDVDKYVGALLKAETE